MRRLLQGDVGSGKTIVALQAMLVAMENGYQAALMAPTEILATQHFLAARKLLERSSRNYRIVLLTGSLDEDRKRANRGLINRGEAQLIIGTHALIEEKVEFDRLGLVVVDEQHRFGVLQRFRLMKKPTQAEPDVLVMTATPIPRTLALSLYGDLEISVLDELPPGRTPIVTRRVPGERAGDVWEFVRKQVALGRQAYIVYPVIAESEKTDLKAATTMHAALAAGPFAHRRLALLHGRLPAEERDAIMRAFRDHAIDVLVATTVIEVGIDVPNATVMCIEHPERFGLSQLHQLRGRVGRGAEESYCILLGDVGPEARERLRVVEGTEDGFEIARADLRLRGMGDLFGERQSGVPTFRVADPLRDEALNDVARQLASAILERDPVLERPEHAAIRRTLRDRYARALELFRVG